MSFVKTIHGFLLVVGLVGGAVIARADIEDFKVNSNQLTAEDMADTNSMLARLKHIAVMKFLARLGISGERAETAVTAEFADQYIIDYKVSRPNPSHKSYVELSGHIDADGLRRWGRLAETKSRGDFLRPLFVITSDIPGLTLTAKDTAQRVRDTGVAKEIYTHLNGAFAKLNTRLTPNDSPAVGGPLPPRTAAEIKILQEVDQASGRSSAVWAYLSPTRSGTRLELHYINYAQRRAAVVKSEDLALEARDFTAPRQVAKALQVPLREFENEITDLVSRGTLQSGAHRLIVEGLDTYRGYKQLDTGLTKLDYVSQAILKRSETNVAEFEVLSSLSTEELSQRLVLVSFPGFQLKPVRVDSPTIVMRMQK